jgi:hypothetical protein
MENVPQPRPFSLGTVAFQSPSVTRFELRTRFELSKRERSTKKERRY